MTNEENADKFNQVFSLLKERMRDTGIFEFESFGSCMEPLVMEGDRLVVKRIERAACLAMGDIVLYQVAAGLCAHRYLYTARRRGCEKLIIKSDNAVGPYSEEISFSHILGKVICIRRGHQSIRLDAFPGSMANVCIGFFVFLHFMGMRLARRVILLKCRIMPRTIIPGFWQICAFPLVLVKNTITKIFFRK